jgi:hypothetical protein
MGQDDTSVKPSLQQVWTWSIYAKPGTGNFLALYISDSNGFNNIQATFNVSTGVVSQPPVISISGPNSPFTNAFAAITPAANGFYRCSLTFTSSNDIGLRPYFSGNQNNSYLLGSDSSATTTILVFGPQLEQSNNPSPYVATVGSPVTFVTPIPMSMIYTFNFVLSPVDSAIVTSSGVLPRPAGVALSIVQL